MKTYTVVGIYCDNKQRHCDHIEASTADAAEKKYRHKMMRKGEEMLVAGVIEGAHCCVDPWNDATCRGFV